MPWRAALLAHAAARLKGNPQRSIAGTAIRSHVLKINEHVRSIAVAAAEQSTGLHEINIAVNQMDQVTQRNAAMVEETTAATHRVSEESDNPARLNPSFKLEGGSSHPREANDRMQAAASPARALGKRLAGAFGAGAS